VLVGHSYDGLIVRPYASMYPKDEKMCPFARLLIDKARV
jgi:pimeloyl-ACP methyl ester carboxylesterase